MVRLPTIRSQAARAGGPTRDRAYMPQLDALRFFAILAVLVQHNWQPRPLPWIFANLDWGDIGVRLFFVLSGFLITGILLGGRTPGDQEPRARLFFMRQFYIRRFLRIFPIYYLVLVVAVLVGVRPALQIAPWLFTYTTNIFIWHHGHWVGDVGHFWSLAVEEQFYVFWPCLLLFAPKRWITPLLVAVICVAPAYRLYASFHYSADLARGAYTSGTLTLAVLDSLGLGALLALVVRRAQSPSRLQRTLTRGALPVGAVVYGAVLGVSHYTGEVHISYALGSTAMALIFCWLIGIASYGFGGPFGRLLELSPIVYLGKISYGIYIFHNFVPAALSELAKHVDLTYHERGLANFAISSAVTCGIAAVSWHLFEAPINNLKRLFPYLPGREIKPAPHPGGDEREGFGGVTVSCAGRAPRGLENDPSRQRPAQERGAQDPATQQQERP
jgi:peptidoglycan/LPS O-acetylase OafA/YrhL